MLQVLDGLIAGRGASRVLQGKTLDSLELNDDDLQRALPFWAPVDIARVQGSLQNLGLLLIDPNTESQRSYYFAINDMNSEVGIASVGSGPGGQHQPAPSSTPSQSVPQAAVKAGAASFISPNWQPDASWLGICKQHGIPEDFSMDLVPEFIAYWRDAGKPQKSWGNTFFRWAKKAWVNERARSNLREIETTMSASWAPNPDAIEILANSGVSLGFIEDSIPEFILYWRERGAKQGTWNTQFIKHIRDQWAKFSASIGCDDTPKLIPENWQPSGDCWDIVALAEIDIEFARSKIPEFILYWKDSQEVRKSWNSIFLEYIKKYWARQLKQRESADLTYAEDQTLVGSSQQRVDDKLRQLADRSWAE